MCYCPSPLDRHIWVPMNANQLPLTALRSFEAVARHASVKKAAAELGVIPSAVSHQIRKLEQRVGSRLFDRRGRQLVLTPEGERLLPGVATGLETIAQAFADHHRERVTGPLRVSVLETFALYWLLPKMVDYPFADEGRSLRLLPTQRLVSFDTENVDAAIRLGGTQSPDLEADPLFSDTLTLVAAPSVAEGAPVFISRHRLEEWNEFHDTAGVHDRVLVLVESASLAIKAATDGVGLAFAPVQLVEHELAAGRLHIASAVRVAGRRGHYSLLYPKLTRRDPRLRAFREWLLSRRDGMSSLHG